VIFNTCVLLCDAAPTFYMPFLGTLTGILSDVSNNKNHKNACIYTYAHTNIHM